MTLERIKFLDFRSEDPYPMTFLTVSILEQLWLSRTEKKKCPWPSIRAGGVRNSPRKKRKAVPSW